MGIVEKTKSTLRRANFRRQKAQFRKLERENWLTVAREIAPSSLEYKADYIICDETLIAYILVGVTRHGERGLPKTLTPTIVKNLMAISHGNYTVGLTVSVVPVPTIEASHMIHKAEMSNVANQYVERDSNKSAYVSSDTRSDMKDINDMAQKIQSQSGRLFTRAFVLSVLAETKEDMDIAIGHIRRVLGSKLIRNEIPTGKMKETMLTALPFPFMPRWAQDDTLSEPLAALFAVQDINTNSDTTGLRLGTKKGDPSQQITVNLEKLPAMHLLAIGQTGAGKSTALLIWLLRLFTELHWNCVFITAKKDAGTDHRRIANSLGADGTIIDIGQGKHRINPLQIVYDESQIEDTNYGWASVVFRHIKLVTRFFAVFLEEGMTPPKKSYIYETLTRLYAEYGIHVDRPETLKEALKNAKYPHIDDLIQMWKNDQKSCGQGDRGKTIASMVSNTFQLTKNGPLGDINGDTTFEIGSKFIVIDVSGLDEDIRDAMNVFVTGIVYQKFRAINENNVPTIIAIDESRIFLENKTTRHDITRQLTLARSERVGMWFGTQQLDDLVKAGVEDVFKNNIFIDVVFGPGKDHKKASLVVPYYGFNEFEKTAWINCDVGEAMISFRGDTTPVKIQLTPHDLKVLKGTDSNNETGDVNQATAIENPIDEQVRKLVEENKVCLSSWIPEAAKDRADDYFSELGWTPDTCTSATGAGLLKVWVRPGLIQNGKVGAQSKDHYFTVLQIAGYLLIHGIERTSVYHTDNVDVSTTIGAKRVAFEFEKPDSHTSKQLFDKQKRAEVNHDICYFVGTRENFMFLKGSVTKQNVIQRGINLKQLLDMLIEETL